MILLAQNSSQIKSENVEIKKCHQRWQDGIAECLLQFWCKVHSQCTFASSACNASTRIRILGSSVSRTQKLAFVVGLLSSDVSSHLTLFPNFTDLFKAAVVKLCERVHALTRAFRYTNRRHT